MPRNELREDGLVKAFSNKGNEVVHYEDGVDITLIRWMLSMTPAERLQTLQQNVRSIMRLRNAKSNT
ncbi:MAG: hypothetical protein ACE5GV_09090 [Candidatus Scalindua sp.]